MMPGQWLLLLKIGVIGALLVAVFMFGHRTGADAVQSDWDSEKAQLMAEQKKLILEHTREMETLQAKQYAINYKVGEEHEQALQTLGKKYAIEIAAVRASGGLRIPKSACSGSSIAGTETTSNSGSNETASATFALPYAIEAGLFKLAEDADGHLEQLRACQNWIRLNGFYGDQTPH